MSDLPHSCLVNHSVEGLTSKLEILVFESFIMANLPYDMPNTVSGQDEPNFALSLATRTGKMDCGYSNLWNCSTEQHKGLL